MKVYFFGVWTSGKVGHTLHDAHGKPLWQIEKHQPWGLKIDQGLCPALLNAPDPSGQQGQAALHHLGGWTALAWWDQTGDRRDGSNSVLLAEGVWTTEDMLAFGREHFPAQMARQNAPIICVARPTEVSYEAVACWKCKRPGRRAVLPGEWSHDPPGWLRREKLLACSPGCAE